MHMIRGRLPLTVFMFKKIISNSVFSHCIEMNVLTCYQRLEKVVLTLPESDYECYYNLGSSDEEKKQCDSNFIKLILYLVIYGFE